MEMAAQEAEQDRDDMLEEIASKVYPFRKILCIQDFEANEATIDKNISAHQDVDFNAAFAPSEMRCLALVSHNGMKATMKKFVLANKNMLLQESVEDVVSHLYMRESYYLDPKKVKRSQLVRLVGMIVDQINGGVRRVGT